MNENNEFDALKDASCRDVLKLIIDKQRAQFNRNRFSADSGEAEESLSLSESVRADMRNHFEILSLMLLLVEKIMLEPAGKTVRRCLAILTCVVVLFCVSGCGAPSNVADDIKQPENAEPISFDDIEWSVDDCVFEGERCVGFGYTNNTQYPLLGIEIEFAQKENLTDEEQAAIDSFKQEEEWYFDDEDEDTDKEFVMKVLAKRYVAPGESINGVPCLINSFLDFDNMALYEAMEPDIASIAYVGADNKLHLAYYDFRSQTLTESNHEPVSIDGWSDSKISKLIPAVDAKAIIVDRDEDDKFTFEAYGVSYDYFEGYVNACKEAGFTNIDRDDNDKFRAENSDEYEVTVEYSSFMQCMSVRIKK